MRMTDVDLSLGTVSITKSRDEQHESAPKTEGSVREIKLLPNVLDVLRAMPKLLHVEEDTHFFRNPEGGPITTTLVAGEELVPGTTGARGPSPEVLRDPSHIHLRRALEGCNLKWVAEYCGTSVEMIEKSYGKFIADDSGSDDDEGRSQARWESVSERLLVGLVAR